MTFKRFCDYGGYSYGWICSLCGQIIDEIPENRQWLEGGRTENKNARSHDLRTSRMGIERR